MEQLVIGMPPASVCWSIACAAKQLAPNTESRHPISLSTVCRAWAVLLVLVQTLAAHRLGKANKWGQIFHDATSRRQISFENLAISIEEDELFR